MIEWFNRVDQKAQHTTRAYQFRCILHVAGMRSELHNIERAINQQHIGHRAPSEKALGNEANNGLPDLESASRSIQVLEHDYAKILSLVDQHGDHLAVEVVERIGRHLTRCAEALYRASGIDERACLPLHNRIEVLHNDLQQLDRHLIIASQNYADLLADRKRTGQIWLYWLISGLLLVGGAIVLGMARQIHGLILARQGAEEELRHEADHDNLTGILNRASFEGRLAQAVQRAR